jgi:beta-lactamase class A
MSRHIIFVVCICMILFPLPGWSASDEMKASLILQFSRLEEEYGGHLGLMARHLKTRETLAYHAEEKFPTASVIKLPIMAAYFDLVRVGKIDPNRRLILQEKWKKPGSGILQQLSEGSTSAAGDLVKLMIMLSDNTATNLVLDQMGDKVASQIEAVNHFAAGIGLKNTRLLNRVYSPETKQQTPEAIRYGFGVSTPEDMVKMLELMYRGSLVNAASSQSMISIMKQQFYADMIPRFLPARECDQVQVAHKTGFVQESQSDVGLIFSPRADIAMAIFVDKQSDHREVIDNRGNLLGARAAQVVWDYFTSGTVSMCDKEPQYETDWNRVPGGRWGIYRSAAAPFPHPERESGFKSSDGTVYPKFPHYSDNSVIVFVPDRFKEDSAGAKLLIHFHGHMNDNLGVLERFRMIESLLQERINAILIIPQGPYRSRDSFGGKMEDEKGLQRLVEDVMSMLVQDKIVSTSRVSQLILSAHSGGYHPLAYSLEKGGMADQVSQVFLFDALYAQQEFFRKWLEGGKGVMRGAFTDHLAKEHQDFAASLKEGARSRFIFELSPVPHDEVVQNFLAKWLHALPEDWHYSDQ